MRNVALFLLLDTARFRNALQGRLCWRGLLRARRVCPSTTRLDRNSRRCSSALAPRYGWHRVVSCRRIRRNRAHRRLVLVGGVLWSYSSKHLSGRDQKDKKSKEQPPLLNHLVCLAHSYMGLDREESTRAFRRGEEDGTVHHLH